MTDAATRARHFQVCGLPVTVATDSPALLDAACAMLEPFAIAEARETAWRIEVRYGQPAREWVDDRPFVAEGTDERGLPWRLHYGPDGSAVWVGDRTAAKVSLARRLAQVRAVRGAEGEVPITAMIVALDDFLTTVDQFMVHAACLRASAGDDSPLVLLFASSGTGKTTTALALARRGMALVSDDATVLSAADGRVRAWGLPRATKVHRRTAALLPWLAPALRPFPAGGEQAVGLRELSRVVSIGAPTPARVGLIVALEKPNPDGHRLAALSARSALEAMVVENVRPVDRSAQGVAARRFAVLARAAAAAPAHRLSVGPDLDSLADLLASAGRV